MKYIFYLLLIWATPAYSQQAPIRLPYSKSLDSLHIDAAIKNYAAGNRVTVLFRTYSAWSTWNHYSIIAQTSGDKWESYQWMEMEKTNALVPYVLKADTVKMIWVTCTAHGLLNMETEKGVFDHCGAMIYDAAHVEFIIISGNQYQKVSYYAPQFFMENCPQRPQNTERKNISVCAAIFKAHFHN